MTIPANLKYTKDHEWVRIEGDTATFGITDHAQEALGDIVFVELPEIGRAIEAGESYAVVESVKAVSDIYAPVGGEVIAVNEDLEAEPEKINTDAFGGGWIAKINIGAGASLELMSDDEYTTFLEE